VPEAPLLLGAFDAQKRGTDELCASVRRDDPWTVLPWWVVTHMLAVPALEVRHPVALSVLVKAHNPARRRLPRRAG
jgi:hypothetical protein